MNWRKLGQVFSPEDCPKGFSHATVPIAIKLTESTFKIIYSSRDEYSRSVPFSLVFDVEKLQIIETDNEPFLSLGETGSFDDCGVMPTCCVSNGSQIYLYYIGWNQGKNVPFRNSIGVAVSEDGGTTFRKAFAGPVLDRSIFDPVFVASCDIFKKDNNLLMYYLSGIKWEQKNNGFRHYYHIKIAQSQDFITWKREGRIAIDFKDPDEYAISVPRVVLWKGGEYRMFYSYRGGALNEYYQIGCAKSNDLIEWLRVDEEVNLSVSVKGWDSEMLCYPFIFAHNEQVYMLYNGNGYGKTGFGLAILVE
ncbi:hypothetical protein WSM22_17380 [Cytophagales bacterium WSM2-2]|nr:hypothetical protein WSM22_17380 [Cytophagales bacterium WSM2-2]